MVHGDDAGLKLPPRVAPVQTVVIPIWRTPEEMELVEATVNRITERLTPTTRLRVDWRDDRTPGFNYHATQYAPDPAPLSRWRTLDVLPSDVRHNTCATPLASTQQHLIA
jgi:prolyl-tRNA synthetase